jgi:hypothetical protein
MYNKLETIFASFLGNSARGVSERGQVQFDCPECCDSKFNLEINFSKGVFQCWKCNKSGKLSKLIKQFGNEQILKDYFNEITNIRESRLYQLNSDNIEISCEHLFELPKCCVPIDKNIHTEGYNYLRDRGLNDNDIKRYNIYCTGSYCNKCTPGCKYKNSIRNRIIFTNWNFGSIDYMVGRLYKDNKYQTRYLLPYNSNKRDIIWNYNNIQWTGEVRLVEGILDSYVVPNCIPILGKKLNSVFRLFNMLFEHANSVLLIPDYEEKAYEDWTKIYDSLNIRRLKGKVRMVDWYRLSILPDCKDTSDLYRIKGKKGIIELLRTAEAI